jgi:hypothetical protein
MQFIQFGQSAISRQLSTNTNTANCQDAKSAEKNEKYTMFVLER